MASKPKELTGLGVFVEPKIMSGLVGGRVALTVLPDGKVISTVDLRHLGAGCETMVFPSETEYSEIECQRYETKDHAWLGHLAMVHKYYAPKRPVIPIPSAAVLRVGFENAWSGSGSRSWSWSWSRSRSGSWSRSGSRSWSRSGSGSWSGSGSGSWSGSGSGSWSRSS
jgi:hypothetical protein